MKTNLPLDSAEMCAWETCISPIPQKLILNMFFFPEEDFTDFFPPPYICIWTRCHNGVLNLIKYCSTHLCSVPRVGEEWSELLNKQHKRGNTSQLKQAKALKRTPVDNYDDIRATVASRQMMILTNDGTPVFFGHGQDQTQARLWKAAIWMSNATWLIATVTGRRLTGGRRRNRLTFPRENK